MSSWGQEPCFLGECHSAVGTECWMRHLHKHLCSSGCWLTLVARKRARALNAQWIWVRDLAVSSAVSDEHRASDWVMVTGLTLQEKGWVCAGRRIMIWKWGGSGRILILLLTSCLQMREKDQLPPSGQSTSNTTSVLYAEDLHIFVSTLDLSSEF